MNSFGDLNQDPVGPNAYMSHPSESALNELKRTHGSVTGKWLRGLVNQALESTAQADSEDAAHVEEDDLQMMIRWMGRLFDEFELYTLEFNRNAAGTDLIINSSPPNLENTNVENDNFEAHLSTRFWTMGFSASSDAIDVYLIPAELVLAFTTNRISETERRPFLTLQAARQGHKYCWLIGNYCIKWEMLPELARELFADLINVASGQMGESELYNLFGTTDPAKEAAFEPAIAQVAVCEPGSSSLPSAPDAGPEFHSKLTQKNVSTDFFIACDNFNRELETEIQTLSQAGSSNNKELLTAVKCEQLMAEMKSLQQQVASAVTNMKTLMQKGKSKSA